MTKPWPPIRSLALTLPLALALMSAGACHGARPVRLVAGIDDTVIVNSARPTAIPLELRDNTGRAAPARRTRFEWLAGDRFSISPAGEVRCPHAGDATVRATSGTLSTTFTLYCRPIREFVHDDRNYGFLIGGPPRRLDVVGQGLDGRPVTLLAARIHVRDSSIVDVHRGLITPKHAGSTGIDVYVADFHASYFVAVLDLGRSSDALRPYQAFIGSASLSPDSARAWPVARGRYEVRFLPNANARGSVLLAAANANCARYPDGGLHLSCVVSGDNASILASGTTVPGASPRPAPITGRIVVRRLADAPIWPDYSFDAANYPIAR